MYLVFDIGGTFVKSALINAAGNIQTKSTFPTPDNIEALIECMIENYMSISTKIKGIAISCPGTVDINTGKIYHGGKLRYLHQQNLVQLLGEKCKVPIAVENDAKSAALAELWLGSVKGYENAIVLVLGSAVGAGFIINGKLYRGKKLSAGEVSYMGTLNPDTLNTNLFGPTGSAVNMIKNTSKKKGIDVSGHHVFDLINKKDPEATAIFDKYCLQLAAQIMNLQYLLDPEVIAIGGGISAQPIVVEGIQQAINKIKVKNPIHHANPNIVSCKFQNDANLLGALYNFFELKQEDILPI
ncbi:ROK family protein [Priestia aryabhattai]|uniref:ROK family protein n=1 Tax=Priestia aryabhattai TaxID=412384 RepID=UPI003981B1DE